MAAADIVTTPETLEALLSVLRRGLSAPHSAGEDVQQLLALIRALQPPAGELAVCETLLALRSKDHAEAARVLEAALEQADDEHVQVFRALLAVCLHRQGDATAATYARQVVEDGREEAAVRVATRLLQPSLR